MNTQMNYIKNYLLTYGSIDPRQALEACGCTRLSARIFELKAKGWTFRTQPISGRNKVTGGVWNSVRYILESKNVQ